MSEGIPVLPLPALVCMKLLSGRRRDQMDVVGLLEAGVDPRPVREYLAMHEKSLVADFGRFCEES